MLIACPGCGAQESRCREVLPACRKLAADRERFHAAANGIAGDITAALVDRGAVEAPALRSRVSELEAALREACEIARSRDAQQPWCRYCGRAWLSREHLAGSCRIGRGLAVLPATVAP